MKIICTKSELLNGVSIVSKAVPSKTTMSILQCILIDAEADQIKLVANDMELGIETIIKGSIAEKGKIALDARMLFDIIRKLPDSDVTITTDASLKANISCEKSKFCPPIPIMSAASSSSSSSSFQRAQSTLNQTCFPAGSAKSLFQ